MTRQPRRESGTDIYHIMVRGINKERIFEKEKDYRKIFNTLKEQLDSKIEIYAYCIMPNHLHLLMKIPFELMTVYMHHVEVIYAQYYNLSRERVGHVFQGRFKSECVENEKYFWNCLRYIHNNPVKANLVKAEDVYRWSSEWEYLRGKNVLLHEKAIKLCAKRKDLFEQKNYKIEQIFLDIKEEEEKQKIEYFNYNFQMFLKEKNVKADEWHISTKLVREFRERLASEDVLSKTLIDKMIRERRNG